MKTPERKGRVVTKLVGRGSVERGSRFGLLAQASFLGFGRGRAQRGHWNLLFWSISGVDTGQLTDAVKLKNSDSTLRRHWIRSRAVATLDPSNTRNLAERLGGGCPASNTVQEW